MARPAAQEGLFPRVFQPHRAARLPGQQRAQELALEEILLGPEAAAHMVHQHPHLVQWQPQHLGHDAAHHEGRLGGQLHGQAAVAIPLADADIGLHVGRRRAAAFVLAFDDQVGLAKATFDIATCDTERRDDQVAAGTDLMQQRRTGCQRVFHREDGGQRLVVDLDQVQRRFGDLFRGGRHHGHAFAPVTHLAVQDVLVGRQRGRTRVRRAGVQHARHVLVRQHRLHAGQRQRPRRVDAPDVGVCHLAAQRARVQHARQLDVAGVLRRSGDLAQQVDTLDAVADDGAVAHLATPSRAVTSMASMILV